MSNKLNLTSFNHDFRIWKKRIDILLKEFKLARNEYEHPSLEFRKLGNILEWGTINDNDNGEIRIHIGKEQFAIVIAAVPELYR